MTSLLATAGICQLVLCLTKLDDEMRVTEEGVQIHQCVRANLSGLRCYLASCL